MVEFHKKRRAYNEKVRGIKQDGGSKELKTIDTDSISRAKKRYREEVQQEERREIMNEKEFRKQRSGTGE